MIQRSVSHFDQLVAQYLSLEELSVTEEMLDACGASIDIRILPLLKRRLHEEEARVTALEARGYVRMQEKCEQLITCLSSSLRQWKEGAMSPQTTPRERNIDGLRRSAQTKAEDTRTVTSAAVAAWMLAEVSSQESLWQTDAVDEIGKRFGPEFIYENERGTPYISKAVLKEFHKLSIDTVVWEKGYRTWWLRDEGDPLGRRQVNY